MGASNFFSSPFFFAVVAVCLVGVLLHLNNEIVQLRTKLDDVDKYFLRKEADMPEQRETTKAEEKRKLDLQGPPGPAGPKGPPGPSGGGVTYTRWGRTTCPTISGTTLVYEGLAAGSHYNHHGGAANIICIVKNPMYNPGTTTVDKNGGVLYGSEYEIYEGQALNRGLRHDHNIPCAVCHVSTRSSQIMVPGTYQCPSGWTPEYGGWLMGGHHGHKGRNMFACIDKDAEVVPGQQANNNGNLFYHFEVDCGVGIPCPPYNARKELSCVVCTQ